MHARFPCLLVALALFTGCASGLPEADRVDTWRHSELDRVGQEPDSSPESTNFAARVDEFRGLGALESARALCLRMVAVFPDDAALLWRAARAEADWVLILRDKNDSEDERKLASASGLDFAR